MEINYLSASRIKTYQQCQLKYYAIYEEKLEQGPPHPLTVMGSALHNGFEYGVKELMDGNKANFPALVKKSCASLMVSKPNADLAVELTNNALNWGYLRNIDYCVGVEISFYEELPDGTKVKGFIDRFDRPPQMPDIIDLKTQKNAFEGDVKDEWQSVAYNWASRKLYPDIKGDVRVSYWVLRHRVQRCWMNDDDAKRGEDALMAVAEEIRSCTDPKPTPSPLCQWCPKQADCPASRENAKDRLKRKMKK
jgi:putative RecB family exonuclease